MLDAAVAALIPVILTHAAQYPTDQEVDTMPKSIREAHPVSVREADAQKSGRLQVGFITPGWGSSGYYSQKVLENAAAAKVFPAGTQMFLDHPGEAEAYDRPERSVRDLAAVLTEDAVWDGERLAGEVQVFGPFVDMLTDENFAKAIGVSIRALAEVTTGEAEGRRGRIVTDLVEAQSVDFVTKAGRGGSILAVLESARPAAVVERAVAHGVAEATANDTREALAQALREEFGGEKSWVWVRDFDEATVWFEWETPDESGTYALAYTMDDAGAVTIDPATRTEVRARTEYVPVTQSATEAEQASSLAYATRVLVECGVPAEQAATAAVEALRLSQSVPAPAGQPTPTPSSKEDTMGTIQVDESQHAALTEAAGRVPTLESERDTAVRERDEAREALATTLRNAAASTVIDTQAREAGVTFTALERRGLLAELPVAESGELDTAAFTEAVTTAAAEKATAAGAGSIRGFGETATADATESDATPTVRSAFGNPVQEG